jgi:ABC-2 type transport system permease protein
VTRALKLTWYQFRLERRMFWRNPTAAFFGIVLPLVFLALFGTIASGDQSALDQLVPGIAAMSVAANTFSALTMQITILRDQGVLKRIRGTALPMPAYLSAVIGSAVVNAFAQVGVVVLIGKLFFGLDWPPHPIELVVIVGFGVLCLASLGVAYAHVIPDADVASPYMNIVFLPVLFISGAFFDTENTPQFLQDVAQALPLKHIVDGLTGAMVTGDHLTDHASGLAIIALWTVAGVYFAIRGFRWESRRG